jgi:thiamine pyrophosphokinase
MKAAIVSHGEIRDYDYIRKIMEECDIIVCADGGLEYVQKCGLIPDALIGDLDSVSNDALEKLQGVGKTKIVKYPREKDYTDTQLAVDYAVEQGADEIVLLGSTGDRIDHSLANLLLLVKLIRNNIKSCVIDEKNSIFITNNSIKLNGNIGDLVSLIPIGGDVTGIFTDGLQYRLCGATITLGDPLGISNVFTSKEIEVKIESGYLLVIKSKD